MNRSTRAQVLLVLAMMLVAVNFRTPIASVPPLLETIRADIGTNYTTMSLLTTIPVLCFGLFAFVAPAFSDRFGRERSILLMVALIGASVAVRAWGTDTVVLFGSAVSAGIGIAVGQALLPPIVKDRFVGRAGLVTGLYSGSMSGGAAIAAAGTAPLMALLGSWPLALSAWVVVSVLAAVAWFPIARDSEPGKHVAGPEPRSRIPWRSGWAWLLTLFFAGQAHIFYSLLTWLPPRYVALGWTGQRAGLLLTAFTATSVVGTILASVSDRWPDRRPWLVLAVGLWLVGLAGITFVPLAFPWGFTVLTGVGAGTTFALALTLPVDYAPDPDAADRLTAMVVGVGYTIAAVGPFAIGAIRDVVGDFQFAYLTMLAVTALLLAASALFAPDRVVRYAS